MLIKLGYEIGFEFTQPAAMLLMLYMHPSRAATTRIADNLIVTPYAPVTEYLDGFGNRCGRVSVMPGRTTFRNDALVEDCGLPDIQAPAARQHAVEELPTSTLTYLLASRYCEVDSELKDLAWSMFGGTPLGWPRVQAVCNFVHNHIRFDYQLARANRTGLDAYREPRRRLPRLHAPLDHLLCRCLNIPARYCTGYLGDIGIPPVPFPMDFSAWFEVYLGGQWYAFDARHNVPRIGRVLMARGRDAADVALTTTFGNGHLTSFTVWTDEVAG